MPDRFECDEKPAIEVGECEACDNTMYDYEQTQCGTCEAKIHKDCQKKCDYCGNPGCAVCLKDENGLLICSICQEKRAGIIDDLKNGDIPSEYNFAGEQETDEQIILEYISSDNPKIYIHIDKRKTKDEVAKTAKKAATTGNHKDLQEYLRLRKENNYDSHDIKWQGSET